MDTDPELTTRALSRGQPRRPRRGIAMVTAIFALVIVGVLVAGMYNLASLQARAVKNRTGAARALLLAEAGAAHAVMLARDTLKKKSNSAFLRGSDNTPGTADDSVLVGFGLSSGVQIPRAGFASSEGRYWVKFRDDDDGDGDPFRDSNMRIIARCSAATPDSGYAAVDIVVSGVSQMPGFFSNGNLAVGGSTEMTGACGDIHANGNMTFANPGAVISGDASATGTITNGGVVRDTLGAANPTLANQAPLDVPPLPYSTFCPSKASYTLRSNGQLWNHTVSPAVHVPVLPAGLSRTMSGSAVLWSATGTSMNALPGVLCVEGNFALSGNSGTAASPLPLTIIATQSVQVTGTPYLRPATADSVTIVAGADVSVAGNPSGGAYSYEGLIYANSQCVVTGNAKVNGNVVCRNAAHTTAAIDYAASNSMGGSTELRYGCGGYFNQPRRILQWVQLVQ